MLYAPLQLRLVVWRTEQRQRDIAGIAPACGTGLLQFFHGAAAHTTDRHPTIGVLRDSLEHPLRIRADPDRRATGLEGFWVGPEFVEIHEFTMVFGFLLRPNLFHRQDFFTHFCPALGVVRAMVLHFLAIPPGTNAEHNPAARQHIEGCHLFGQCNWVPLDDQTNPGTQSNALRHRGAGAQGDEGVVGVPVLSWQVTPTRERRRARCGNVGVLWKEQAIETTLFDGSGKRHGLNRIVSREHLHAKIHRCGITHGLFLLLIEFSAKAYCRPCRTSTNKPASPISK